MANSFFTAPSGTPGLGITTQTVPILPGQIQQFRTNPVPNTATVMYQLQIRDSTAQNQISLYTFPLSPESVRKEWDDMSNFYDVQGDASNKGVLRVVDTYGMTPVTFMIEGTTGWKLHSIDNYQYTGLQSLARVEQLLGQYATLNQSQIAAGNNNLYQLWFFDFFRGDYWQVQPVGRQGIRQSNQRPQWPSYAFRLVGVRDLSAVIPAGKVDVLDLTLTSSNASSASQSLQNFTAQQQSTYAGVTAAAS